jgi:uncharacterized protein YndB with AHSA1/START domain
MHGPDGIDYRNEIVYVEIMRPERLVYDHVSGPKFHVTVTFDGQGDKTKVTMHMVFETAAELVRVIKEFGAIEGAKQTFGRLAEYMTNASKREFTITRVFDAPPELVFKAWTQPQHLMRWWAPKGFTTGHCTVDLRPGGVFHYSMRSPEGQEIWGIGVYREIVEPERIVYTDSFADAAGNPVPPSYYGLSTGHPLESLVTVTFAGHEGKTTLTLRHNIPTSAEEREGTVQGWNEMLDRLAEDLATVRT